MFLIADAACWPVDHRPVFVDRSFRLLPDDLKTGICSSYAKFAVECSYRISVHSTLFPLRELLAVMSVRRLVMARVMARNEQVARARTPRSLPTST